MLRGGVNHRIRAGHKQHEPQCLQLKLSLLQQISMQPSGPTGFNLNSSCCTSTTPLPWHVIHQRATVTATAASCTLLLAAAAAAAQSRASGHLQLHISSAACFVANQSKKAHDQQSINSARPGKRYLLCLPACSCAPTPCLVRDTNVRGRPFVILEAGEFDLGRVHSSRWVAVLLPRCSSWDAASPAPLCSLWVHRAGV